MHLHCPRIGLTGGIGSGKSTVAAMLQDSQAIIIDADAIARAATAPGGSAMQAIRLQLGDEYVAADGALDRARMRKLAFSDPAAKEKLERIVHPLVRDAIQLQTRQAEQRHPPCIVYDIPLLVESGRWRQTLDRVIVVDCEPNTQIQRVQQRSGLSPDAIRSIMATQAPRLQRLQAADAVLCNDGISLSQLETQVRQVWARFGL